MLFRSRERVSYRGSVSLMSGLGDVKKGDSSSGGSGSGAAGGQGGGLEALSQGRERRQGRGLRLCPELGLRR